MNKWSVGVLCAALLVATAAVAADSPAEDDFDNLNLELNGNEVTLTLLNTWPEMEAKLGDSLWNWEFARAGYAVMLAAVKVAGG